LAAEHDESRREVCPRAMRFFLDSDLDDIRRAGGTRVAAKSPWLLL
jgi:hypothetical protein